MNKVWHWAYKGYSTETELTRNGFWRWYSIVYKYSNMRDEPERRSVLALGNNSLTRRGAIKEVKKEIDEIVRREAELSSLTQNTKEGEST